MTSPFLTAWIEETKKRNAGKTIRPGMQVVDCFGHRGIVVVVDHPENVTAEDHGTIAVWQKDKLHYGDDNCEHYSFHGWETMLRIEKE